MVRSGRVVSPHTAQQDCHRRVNVSIEQEADSVDGQPGSVRRGQPSGGGRDDGAHRSGQLSLSSVEAIWATFCHHIFFFTSRDEAERWAVGRTDIAVLSMDEAYALGQEFASSLLAVAQRSSDTAQSLTGQKS